MQHDEEAQVREEDQQFEEKIYVPAGGGWKTMLLVGILLFGVGGLLLGVGIAKEMEALFYLGFICMGAGFICCICTC